MALSPATNFKPGGILDALFQSPSQSPQSLIPLPHGGRAIQQTGQTRVTLEETQISASHSDSKGGSGSGENTTSSSYQRFHYDLIHGNTQTQTQNLNALAQSHSDPVIAESQSHAQIVTRDGQGLPKSLSFGIVPDASAIFQDREIDEEVRPGRKAPARARKPTRTRTREEEPITSSPVREDSSVVSSPDKPLSQSLLLRSPHKTRRRDTEKERDYEDELPAYNVPTVDEDMKARAKKEAEIARRTGNSPGKRRVDTNQNQNKKEKVITDPWAIRVVNLDGKRGLEDERGNQVFENTEEEEAEVDLEPPPPVRKGEKQVAFAATDGDGDEGDVEEDSGLNKNVTPRSAPILSRILTLPQSRTHPHSQASSQSQSSQIGQPPLPPSRQQERQDDIFQATSAQNVFGNENEETQYSQTQLISSPVHGAGGEEDMAAAIRASSHSQFYVLNNADSSNGSGMSQSQFEATQIDEDSANAAPGTTIQQIFMSKSSVWTKTPGGPSPATTSPFETRRTLGKPLVTIREASQDDDLVIPDSQDPNHPSGEPYRDRAFVQRQKATIRAPLHSSDGEEEKGRPAGGQTGGTVIPDSQDGPNGIDAMDVDQEGEETLKKKARKGSKDREEPRTPTKKRALVASSSVIVAEEEAHPSKKKKVSHPVPQQQQQEVSYVGMAGNETHTSTSTSQPSQLPGGSPPFTYVLVFLKERKLFVTGKIIALSLSNATVQHLGNFNLLGTSKGTPERTQANYAFDSLRRLELRAGDLVNIDGERREITWIEEGKECVLLDGEGSVAVRLSDSQGRSIGEGAVPLNLRELILHPPRARKLLDRHLDADDLERLKLSSLGPRLYRSAFLLTYPDEPSTNGKGATPKPARGAAKAWASEKSVVEERIKELGGTLISDLKDVVDVDEELCVCDFWETTMGRKKDVRNIFLLADRPRTSPKYLMALAIGIPCVSTKWVLDEDGGRNWKDYAIGAGPSLTMDTFALGRQWKLMERKDGSYGIKELNDAHPEFMLFKGRTMLIVGDKVLSDGEEAGSANSICRLLIAMGATKTEYISPKDFKKWDTDGFDWIILDDSTGSTTNGATITVSSSRKKKVVSSGSSVGDLKMTELQQAKCCNVPWVKECLITGRVLPNGKL
ncbi:hypothetical protein BT69DRAFT_1347023 [Atractiella rhizophila]|nr:hypothetical protein BT69DRAFT_1347023 [Atractiella rhizophila]